MPEAPRRAATKAEICRRPPAFGSNARKRFGRSKPRRNSTGGALNSLAAMSARVSRVRRRREGGRLHVAEFLPERSDRQVVRPEIVAPLADAVRLVDGKEGDAAAAHEAHAPRQALRCQVEELQLSARKRLHDAVVLLARVGGDERGGRNPVRGELRHLVAHQRDQRRDDDGEPLPHQGRKLVAERLAPAGRHDGEHVAARLDRPHDLLLPGPEGVVAEGLLENRMRRCHDRW